MAARRCSWELAGKTLGVGVDIEGIDRFEKYIWTKDARLLKRLFTANELNYCFASRKPAQHLAARYAGKEAIIKALTALKKKAPTYKDVEILNDGSGVPRARVNQPGFDILDINLSLSHSREQVVAFTVVMQKSPAA